MVEAPRHCCRGVSYLVFRSRRVGQFDQGLPQLARARHLLRKIQPQSFAAGLQIETVRIATSAAPIGSLRAKQPRRIKVGGVPMIGIDVLDRFLLDVQQRARTDDIGEKLLGLEVYDATESCHQMNSARHDAEERKIPEIYKRLCGRVRVEVTAA